ncbi:MAG: type IV pilus assembly protein PilM [Clostridia bacterium]|nr:type IV pilus assembly protein PilM [Clostridia bacterium]
MRNDKKIRKKQLVALDIGTNNIKVTIGRYSSKKVNIKKLITFETPELCISNGRIKDVHKLTELLKEEFKKHKIKNDYCVVNIKSSSIINRELTLPYNDNEKALNQIIYYEMKQFLAIKLDSYVTQYQIIEEFYEDKAKMIKVIVSAIEKDLVEDYLALVKAVGLKPYVLDVHFNTIGKVFWLYNENVEKSDKTIAVVDIGYNSTDVTIINEGQFKMSRTVESGSNLMEHVLKDEFHIDLKEIHNIALFSMKNQELEQRIQSVLDELVEEINYVIRFYISRDSKNKVDEIYFTGGIARYEDVMAYLAKTVQLKQFYFRNLSKMIQGIPEDSDFKSFITLVGAMIRR